MQNTKQIKSQITQTVQAQNDLRHHLQQLNLQKEKQNSSQFLPAQQNIQQPIIIKQQKSQQKNLQNQSSNQQQQGQPAQLQQDIQEQQEEFESNSKWKLIQQPKNIIQLFMIDFAQCDSKKCSGKKMERFKLLTSLKDKQKKKKFRGIVLSAFGKKQVCYQDLQTAQKHGICVIDCSWNRIEQTRQFRYKHQRKLPFVIAGNPINYGKPYQLSCAQALATALCTINYVDQAEYILSKFGWADGFWSLNPNISNYGKCKTLQQLRKQSKSIQQTKTNEFQRNYDLSQNSSDQQER